VIELAGRRLSRAEDAVNKNGWETVRDHFREKRQEQIETAREKLSRYRIREAGDTLKKWLAARDLNQDPKALESALKGRVDSAWKDWESALARAAATQTTEDIHQFRIAAKRLRYRLELLYELGEKDTKSSLGFLKRLQKQLGEWHDRQGLFEAAAEAIARPEILLRDSDVARVLLDEIDAGRLRQRKGIENVFHMAEKRPAAEKNSAPGGSEPAVSSAP
jgi:CHAD domain-containing protein